MARLTVIGQGVRIRGRIQGEGDLSIEGHIEGEVVISGEVTVETGGLVGANVSARVITVRGAVKGDLHAEDVIRLEEGARVVGDLHAPRIAIGKGALVRGLVQTGGTGSAPARPKAQTAHVSAPAHKPAAAPVQAPPRRVPTPAPVQRVVAPAPKPAASAPKPAVHVPTPQTRTQSAPVVASTLAGASHGPPPPTVPALKKGAKAALKKKAT